MALPELTSEQRSAALERACAVRKERADALKSLKAGEITVDDIFSKDEDIVYGRITAKALIMHLPGVGAAKSAKFLEENRIKPTRRVIGLGSRQRAAISEFAAGRSK